MPLRYVRPVHGGSLLNPRGRARSRRKGGGTAGQGKDREEKGGRGKERRRGKGGGREQRKVARRGGDGRIVEGGWRIAGGMEGGQ